MHLVCPISFSGYFPFGDTAHDGMDDFLTRPPWIPLKKISELSLLKSATPAKLDCVCLYKTRHGAVLLCLQHTTHREENGNGRWG